MMKESDVLYVSSLFSPLKCKRSVCDLWFLVYLMKKKAAELEKKGEFGKTRKAAEQ